MNVETKQQKKDRRTSLEDQLRLDGQKLDSLWMQARMATGQARTDLHRKIGPLREKQRADREEHESLKGRE